MSSTQPIAETSRPSGDAAMRLSAGAQPLLRLDSRKLFGSANELLIEHGSDIYRLRWTRSGKLILTK